MSSHDPERGCGLLVLGASAVLVFVAGVALGVWLGRMV